MVPKICAVDEGFCEKRFLFSKECSESKRSGKCKADQEGEADEEREYKRLESETEANRSGEALKEPETSKGSAGTHTGHFICHRVTDRLPAYSQLEFPG